MEAWAEVHRLFHREGRPKAAIARQLAMSRNTVERLLGLTEPPRIHALLARECHALVPDELFSDLFSPSVGRRSVPPLVVAVVMVLQRLEGPV